MTESSVEFALVDAHSAYHRDRMGSLYQTIHSLLTTAMAIQVVHMLAFICASFVLFAHLCCKGVFFKSVVLGFVQLELKVLPKEVLGIWNGFFDSLPDKPNGKDLCINIILTSLNCISAMGGVIRDDEALLDQCLDTSKVDFTNGLYSKESYYLDQFISMHCKENGELELVMIPLTGIIQEQGHVRATCIL